MRIVAHASDLHFGRDDPLLAEALLDELGDLRPALVIVSGDLTQRARRAEFRATAAFLRRLPAPWLAVPGNHDVPLWDVARRFLSPLGRYRRWVAAEVDPFFQDRELAVQGLNTARSATWKEGRISREQIRALRGRLAPLPQGLCKILVTHHPFIPPPADPGAAIVGRGQEALRAAEASGVDLLLAGHLHLGYSADVRAHHTVIQRSMLSIQAGTAISTRVREHPNGYNVLTVELPRLTLEVRSWDGGGFAARTERRYRKIGGEWTREEAPVGSGGPAPADG
ncbi:MAG: metallophosphoesterase [Gemmatimonadota bacterium]